MVHKTNLISMPASNMPAPKTAKAGGYKLIVLAFFSLLILGGASFWLTRAPSERENLRHTAAEKLGSWIDGTPIAGLADFFKPSPPPPPPEVSHPQTEAGTLAGQQITATIAAPLDFGPGINPATLLQPRSEPAPQEPTNTLPDLLGSGQNEQQVVFDQEPVAQVTEDSRIQPAYLARLAEWLAGHYKNGSLTISIQSLNQEAGGKLASEVQGGRSGLLRYAFHPAMISGLYNLYIERFMADLDSAANNKGLSATENKQFHRAIAGRAALLASGFDGVLRVSDLAAKLARIDNLGQKAVDENADLTTAVFELDELRNSGASKQAIATAQMRVDGATARYRRAADEYNQAQTALAGEIRRYSGQNIDEDSLLFMAAWVARRYENGGQARGAIESCIAALRNLSARCARYGEGI